MNPQKSPQHLAKIIAYILGRKPDEFGLVLSEEGFVKLKDLLKALNEEPEYRWVRQSSIDDIFRMLPAPQLEIRDNAIRAVNRDQLPKPFPSPELPKLLYTCVRSRGYPHVLNEGLLPGSSDYIVLSSNRDMALRIGKRSDPSPVLLTVLVGESIASGIDFLQAGETLFLTKMIPPECFTGPPLPKEKPEPPRKEVRKKPRDPFPGSYHLDLSNDRDSRNRSGRKKEKEISRNRDRDRKRKNRDRGW